MVSPKNVQNMCKKECKTMCKLCVHFCVKSLFVLEPVKNTLKSTSFSHIIHTLFHRKVPSIIINIFHISTEPTTTTTKYNLIKERI